MTIQSTSEVARIGIFTDIQYANKPDVYIEYIGNKRYFSQVLSKTSTAVQDFNHQDLSAVFHLGDIIDGNVTQSQTHDDLQAVLSQLSSLQPPLYHVLGNHCLSAQRSLLLNSLNLDKTTYYSVDISSKWRFIILDSVDVSVDRPEDHPHHALAQKYLADHQGEANAQPWNGGLGEEQYAWLKAELEDTQRRNMYAIVCGHLPVLEEASLSKHVIWDSERLAAVLKEFSDTVKAYFGGHFHEGGYALRDGVHHVTFEAILDAQDPKGAWAVVQLSDTSIVIEGFGSMTSRQLSVV